MNRAYQIFSIFIGIGFLYFFYQLFQQNESSNFVGLLGSLNPIYLILSLLFYLVSHFLRGLRIAILMGRQDYSLLTLTKMQFYTNAINLVIPFKLGEIYRIIEFNKLFKEKEKLILSILTEKAVDLVLLLFWAVLAIYFMNDQVLPIFDISILMILAVLFITFVFFVVPENIKYFNLFIAKRYTNSKTNKILRVSTSVTQTT
ncbi:MAG: lysylphosphatidylglycerol synthase domain-containing protein, partial [Cytophagales bacterium]